MTQEKTVLINTLQYHKSEFGVERKVLCTSKENAMLQQHLKKGGSLPEGVYPCVYSNGKKSTSEFFIIYKSDLNEDEIKEYLTYKKLSMIKTIKNCAIFFTVLTILNLVASFIFIISLL